jgi:hypothetical protein
MDPITGILIGKAIEEGVKGVNSYYQAKNEKKQGKKRAKQSKRETLAGLLNDALQGSAELHTHGLSSRARLGKRKAQSLQDTSDLVRGAFNI